MAGAREQVDKGDEEERKVGAREFSRKSQTQKLKKS